MRTNWLLALMAGLVVALAGCFGSGGGDDPCDDDSMDEDCPTPSPTGTGTPTNTTPPEPNKLPMLKVTVSNDGGNTTQTTFMGGNLTFSAAGSTDEDGEIQNIAVTVFDGNRTKGETKSLFAGGKFTAATYNFPTPGVARALVSMVDDDSGFNTTEIPVYVNHPQSLGSFQMTLADPLGSATDCAGSAEAAEVPSAPILDSQYYKAFTFDVRAGATYVEATVTAGDAMIAVCDPDGNAISPEGDGTVTTAIGTNFTAGLAYYVASVSQAPNQSVAVSVVVHYDPQASAEA